MPGTRIAYLDRKIQYGRGKAGSVYGQTYDVYRNGPNVSGSIYDSKPVLSNYPMSPEKAKPKDIENETFRLQVFAGDCDNTKLQLGDVLKETGYEALTQSGQQVTGGTSNAFTGDVFVFAQRRPFRGKNIFVRCESAISITRPMPRSGAAYQQPPPGSSPSGVKAAFHIGVDKSSEWGLVLSNGGYFFSNDPQYDLAGVPAGLLQLNRIRDAANPKWPVALYREHFVIFVPLLNGIQIQELDSFNFPNSDRYTAASVYTSEETGLQGWIIIFEKLGT